MYSLLIKSCCIVLIITVGNTQFTIPTSTNNIAACVNDILTKHFQPSHLILAINTSFASTYPMVRLDFSRNVRFAQFARVDFYVVSSEESEFQQALEYMAGFQNFNPRAKLILIWNSGVGEGIFKLLSDFYMVQVVVIELHSLQLFSYRPYKTGNVDRPSTKSVHLGNCSCHCSVFGYKVPRTWDKSVLKVSYKTADPYVIDPNGTLKGIEIQTLETIKQHLRFQIRYTQYNGTFYDENHPLTYYQAYGLVMTHQMDVAIGSFYLKKHEPLDFDVSFAYLQDGFFWVVPKATITPPWRRIASAFRYDIWIYFFLSLVCFSAIYSLYLKFSGSSSPSIIFFYFFGILIEYVGDVPQQHKVRALLAIWICYSLVISTAFKSQMMNILTGAGHEDELESLQEIVDSKLRINMPQGYANLYDSEEFPLELHVFQNNIGCEDIWECLQRTAVKRDTASTASGRYIEHLMPEFLDEFGRSRVHVLKDKVYPMSIHMIFSKGYPIFEQIDRLIMLLEANGLIDYNYDHMEHISKLRYMIKMTHAKHPSGDGMTLPFVLLGFGVTISFVVLCWELFWNKLDRKKVYCYCNYCKNKIRGG